MEKSICSRGIIVTEVEGAESSVCQNNGCAKLSTHDWLSDIPTPPIETDIVEVQFKNTRKAFFRNANNLPLKKGDVVAVEASPGHDIGTVTLLGWLVNRQMVKAGVKPDETEFKKVYRKAKPADIEKWLEAISLEHNTMIRTRQIVTDLGLNMKIGDVEFQGDRTKAVFYYIADERVDFRELIKILAEEFQIRVEMRQIGARQEAGRIGGIGSCGRELCCSSWINNFVSVTTNSARYQDLTMNPQKLAGQCGKLKCCLNFEVDTYIDAQRDFPASNVPLETEKGRYIFQKADILGGTYWYSLQNGSPNLVPVAVDMVREIIQLNRDGKRPDKLTFDIQVSARKESESFQNMAGQESINRFDKSDPQKRKKHQRRGNNQRNKR